MNIQRIKSFINLRFRSQKLNHNILKYALLKYLNFKVNQGPFKGMKYINNSNGSVLIPKIIGTYECELYDTLQTIFNKNYDILIDIGCAEGYYAVGLAFLNRNNNQFKVYAYDKDPKALLNLNQLAQLNKVENMIFSFHEFNQSEFEKISSTRGLIICDIEGGEKELLDPIILPKLLNYDILVEVHDGKDSDIIKDVLFNRFANTHMIERIEHNPNYIVRLNCMSWIKNRDFISKVLVEGRKYGLDWFFIQKKA